MRQYKFGECIPESVKEYKRLKKKGLKPEFVEGWVEVDYQNLDIDRDFLELYYPDILKKANNDLEFDDYIRVLPHTWLILNNKYIDITKNQFNKFNGIIRYYEKLRYKPKKKIKLKAEDIMNWFDDRDYTIKRNRYIHYPENN